MADNTTISTTTEETAGGSSKYANSKAASEEENCSDWLQVIASYVKQTQTNILDLNAKNFRTNEVQFVLNFLRDSQVTELNLANNCLANGMADLAPLLPKTNIKKLNVSGCRLTNEDLLQLLEVLEDSQITDLDVSGNGTSRFDLDETLRYVACLKKSKVTSLISPFFRDISYDPIPVFREVLNTSITCLDLQFSELSSNDLIFLFTNLGHSLVTDLSLSGVCSIDHVSGKYRSRIDGPLISSEALRELNRSLAEYKIKKLNLSGIYLDNDQLCILVEGVVNSSVSDLWLVENSFSNVRPLLSRLRETQIKTLDLSVNDLSDLATYNYADSLRGSLLVSLSLQSCGLADEAGQRLMEGLRFSNVTKLNMSQNRVGSSTLRKFAELVKDLNLTDLDISYNPIPLNALLIFGNCLKQSKLKRIAMNLMNNSYVAAKLELADFLSFFQTTEGSSVSRIEMCDCSVSFDLTPVCDRRILANTGFSELHFSGNSFLKVARNLCSYLRYSSITHLNLSRSNMGDKSLVTLIKFLKETLIRWLSLHCNSITARGAKALAVSLKDTNLTYLNLLYNDINYDGLKCLAEGAKDTFISELIVQTRSYYSRPEKGVFLIEKVLWQNKVSIHRLRSFFKQMVPQPDEEKFSFDLMRDGLNVPTFLEECMWFYKTVCDRPTAIDVLLEDNVSLSREQLFALVSEKFPKEFSEFIACRIEADTGAHVSILEQAEEMGLTAVVKELLFHRPVYTLDEGQGILHPYVYKLLRKYKQPICNLAVEPRGVEKIVEYFTQHANIEGAQDVINILHDASIS